MRTIYSILYINLNTTLNERVSIGVLVSNGLKNYFKYSTEKLSAFKSILNNERYGLVKNYLRSIEREIGFNDIKTSSQLFGNREFKNDWVNESYLTYLSKYSNNIVQFSLPKTIDVELNDINYKRIFEKYIFRYSEEIKFAPVFDVHSVVKTKLFPRIEKRVNLEKTLTSNDFVNLFAPKYIFYRWNRYFNSNWFKFSKYSLRL